MIKKIINLLKGRKSYIIGLLMIVLGILQAEQNLILEGLTVIFLRAGIKKVVTKNT